MVAPQQNVFYADITGNIGMLAPARVPVRIRYDGSRPVNGWDRDALWSGYIPFDALPVTRNPASGLIVNANNKNHAAETIPTPWPANTKSLTGLCVSLS